MVVALAWIRRALAPGARRALAFLALVGAFHAVFIVLAFLATDAPLGWHLDTAMLRLLLDMRFVLAAAAAIVLFELLRLSSLRSARLQSRVAVSCQMTRD